MILEAEDAAFRQCSTNRLARLRTHRNNMHRYRRLLRTTLTDVE
jgi:hypothetical protein